MKLDGTFGNITTNDVSTSQSEGANWTWDFGSMQSGSIWAVWYANDIAGSCGSKPTALSVTWLVSANDLGGSWRQFASYTFNSYKGYGSKASPITSNIAGSYRYVKVSQYSTTGAEACPGVTYTDAVYATK